MSAIRSAAVVGLGHQARNEHLPALAACRRAELVAVCDTDIDVVTDVAGAWHVPGYTDLTSMLDQVRPDFVLAAVPHHAGAAVITACAQAGVHVMKEKPFATDPHDAAGLAEFCAESGIELMVTVQRRFHPIYTAASGLLEQIGTPYLLDARYTFHHPTPGAGWRGQATLAGGGCLTDMGYHLIDPHLPPEASPSWYALPLRYEPAALGGLPVHRFLDALHAEGATTMDRPGSTRPLHTHPLLQHPAALLPGYPDHAPAADASYPIADNVHDTTVKIPVWDHERDISLADAYTAAIAKVAAHAKDLL